jgi:hypothetical protein
MILKSDFTLMRMKNYEISSIIMQYIFTAILTFSAPFVLAQKLPPIPERWPVNFRNDLSARKEMVEKHFKEYDIKIDQYNAKCGDGKIPANDNALKSYCSNWSYQLDKESLALDKEKENYMAKLSDYEKIYKADSIQKEFQKKEQEKTDKIFFAKSIQEDSTHYKNQLQKLMNDVSRINVPSPGSGKKIHEGIILGLFNTNEVSAITDKNKSVTSAFTEKKYNPGEYFSTSDKVSAKELLRGVVDNSYLGEYTLNTEYGKKLIEKLEGTKFDRLIAHSNGATVSEALIRKGVITVDELNIIGGDRSLINYFGYNELVSSGKVKRVVVWVNPGDIIPYGTTAGLLAPTMAGHYLKTAEDYLVAKFTGETKGGDAGVEYRFLKGPQYKGQDLKFGKDVFDAHGLEVYEYNMKQYFNIHK